MKIKVGVSNRHVHLTRDTYRFLFGSDELSVRNYLNQIGEYASTDTVEIERGGVVLEHVRIVGPFREKNQIELLQSDLDKLGIEAPVRRSGMLDDTPTVNIRVADRSIETTGVIRAERHVHVPIKMQDELGLHERDRVTVYGGLKPFDAYVKASENGFLELHIDKDEALEYGLADKDEVEVFVCGK